MTDPNEVELARQVDLERVNHLVLALADPDEALAAVIHLGSIHLVEAANALISVDVPSSPKALRKEARRQLQRLKSVGIRPEPIQKTQETSGGLIDILASNYDGALTRIIRLYDQGTYTGIHETSVFLNSFGGVIDVERREVGKAKLLDIAEILENGGLGDEPELVWDRMSSGTCKVCASASNSNQSRTSLQRAG